MTRSTSAWIEEVAYKLVGGQRFILRLPPRVGKTYLVRELAEFIGSSAIYVDGHAFTDMTHKAELEALASRIEETVKGPGGAQVLFDSYDTAVSRPGGARLQNWLSRRLIDGVNAQDIGAMFTARCSTQVERPGAGSPLLSRVSPIDPPKLGISPIADVAPEVEEWFGDSSLLADQALSTEDFSPTTVADRCEQDRSYLQDVREAAPEVLRRQRIDEEFDSVGARSAASGLFTSAGPTLLFKRLEASLQPPPSMDPRWPSVLAGSVQKFADLVAGAQTVTWCDRYMYRDIQPLRSFLQAVVTTAGCQVRLLGAPAIGDRGISRAEMLRLNLIPGVEARFITPADHYDLHDRHVFVGSGGFVVPQVHVIVGEQRPGSAVAAAVSRFGVNYDVVWERSIQPS